ncbi:MAG TPA: branched-chain amino acid ABC transporter permease [Alphaproteobacteria bacterium]|nr:branched-chain amino acid ABC transporter permease [Alphaproteobacteria bacterium]
MKGPKAFLFGAPRFDLRHVVVAAGLVILLIVPVVGDAYAVRVASRIVILAMIAISLDILLGYGGLISFGHAMFLGSGGYVVGVLAFLGIQNGLVAYPAAVALSILLAALVGYLVLRTVGVYFIMITLAFAQMLYYVANGVRIGENYGGDEGLPLAGRSPLFGLVDFNDPAVLHYFCVIILAAVLFGSYRLVNSRFGRVLQAAKDNERRVRSLGYNTFRYRLVAFMISGGIAGLAGALHMNLQKFVSPDEFHWVISGDLLIMVIVGGAKSLIGPIIGTAVFVFLEEFISSITEHWMIVFGPLLILVVMFGRGGIYGFIRPKRDD